MNSEKQSNSIWRRYGKSNVVKESTFRVAEVEIAQECQLSWSRDYVESGLCRERVSNGGCRFVNSGKTKEIDVSVWNFCNARRDSIRVLISEDDILGTWEIQILRRAALCASL